METIFLLFNYTFIFQCSNKGCNIYYFNFWHWLSVRNYFVSPHLPLELSKAKTECSTVSLSIYSSIQYTITVSPETFRSLGIYLIVWFFMDRQTNIRHFLYLNVYFIRFQQVRSKKHILLEFDPTSTMTWFSPTNLYFKDKILCAYHRNSRPQCISGYLRLCITVFRVTSLNTANQ